MCNGLDILVNWAVDVLYVQKNYNHVYVYSFIIKKVLKDELIVVYKDTRESKFSEGSFNVDLEIVYELYTPCPRSLLAKKLKEKR